MDKNMQNIYTIHDFIFFQNNILSSLSCVLVEKMLTLWTKKTTYKILADYDFNKE